MNVCPWCVSDPLLRAYHDEEWGVPLYDDRKLFEFLMLESLQCGLSWLLMLKNRAVFRQCFADWDFDTVAAFTEADIARILETPGMLRSRRKVEAVISNARCYQALRREYGSFSDWLWRFTDGQIIRDPARADGALPVRTPLSEAVAAALRARGFRYLGPVTVYSFLQSCGVVDDHVKGCFRYCENPGAVVK